MAPPRFRLALAALIFTLYGPASVEAADITVAVAANFTEPAQAIADAFHEKTGERARLSFGSTGTLYAQIQQGAPFSVFLAADAERPQRAVAEGLGVEGAVFTYAIGAIVLYSPDEGRVTGEDSLRAGAFDRLAIANPETAPYGSAAVEAMRALGVYDALEPKLVRGTNIAQTYQFVQTGNAELGFVAASQIAGSEVGSRWLVPADLYTPIRQDAVLLSAAEDDATAKAFLDFLKSPDAAAIIHRFGYTSAE